MTPVPHRGLLPGATDLAGTLAACCREPAGAGLPPGRGRGGLLRQRGEKQLARVPFESLLRWWPPQHRRLSPAAPAPLGETILGSGDRGISKHCYK